MCEQVLFTKKGSIDMKKSKKGLSTISIVLVVQLILLLVLSVIITVTVSSKTKKSTLNSMAAITDARAEMIEDYVRQAEETLTYFSQASQITDLLKNPNDQRAVEAAQEYTSRFSLSVENLEGIYASKWDTTVLTHTNVGAHSPIGNMTRNKAEDQKALHDALVAANDKVYNTGIIFSPASGKQIVSMYKAIFDENKNPIGLVGLGIYTEGLLNKLDSLTITGAENSFYSMINVKDNKYIFSKDFAAIGTEIDIDEIKELSEKYKEVRENENGSFEYKVGGQKYVSMYTTIPDYNWILMLGDTKGEVYSLTNSMYVYLGIFFVILVTIIAVFNYVTRAQSKANDKLSASIEKNQQTKENLYTAMFKDVLTDVNNRISFSVDIEKCEITADTPYYFAMFDLKDLSKLNVMYGNDLGDWALVKTADVLSKIFKDQKVYRTGSGEFVVVIKGNKTPESQQNILSDIKTALTKLQAQNNTPAGKMAFAYDSAVIKSTKAANSAVVTTLKNIIMNPEPTGALPFVFKELV